MAIDASVWVSFWFLHSACVVCVKEILVELFCSHHDVFFAVFRQRTRPLIAQSTYCSLMLLSSNTLFHIITTVSCHTFPFAPVCFQFFSGPVFLSLQISNITFTLCSSVPLLQPQQPISACCPATRPFTGQSPQGSSSPQVELRCSRSP